MISAKRFTSQGDENGTAQLPEKLFGETVNDHVLWLTVRSYLAHQRQGNASVKSRSEVRGGGRKPWRQKGTGQARAGSRRSPIWVGGGRAFGPEPRDYQVRLPRRVKALGIRSALSLAAREDRVLVVGDPSIDAPRTKVLAELVQKIGASGDKCLLVTGDANRAVYLSGRNLHNLRVTCVGELNAYDLLNCHKLILTEGALGKLKEASDR